MSPAAIKARGEREALIHSTAEQIRTILDKVRDGLPDDDEIEGEILELVTEEDP